MKKILITENQYKNLNEMFPKKLLNLYKDPNKELEVHERDIEFRLKFRNRINDGEYMELRKGRTEHFTTEEIIKLSLLFGDYQKPYEDTYTFKYIRGTFGEPFVKINGLIYKFKDYFIIDFHYRVSLPHSSGDDHPHGMFQDFSTLISFLKSLISQDLFQDKI
jgi:hypothetical protein